MLRLTLAESQIHEHEPGMGFSSCKLININYFQTGLWLDAEYIYASDVHTLSHTCMLTAVTADLV